MAAVAVGNQPRIMDPKLMISRCRPILGGIRAARAFSPPAAAAILQRHVHGNVTSGSGSGRRRAVQAIRRGKDRKLSCVCVSDVFGAIGGRLRMRGTAWAGTATSKDRENSEKIGERKRKQKVLKTTDKQEKSGKKLLILQDLLRILKKIMSEKKTRRKVKDGQRVRAPWFTDEELEALGSAVEARYRDLTRDGRGKPSPVHYQRIGKEIEEAMSAVGTIGRDGDQCRKRWNNIVAAARKLSTNASEQWCTGEGPPKVLDISDLELIPCHSTVLIRMTLR